MVGCGHAERTALLSVDLWLEVILPGVPLMSVHGGLPSAFESTSYGNVSRLAPCSLAMQAVQALVSRGGVQL